MEMINYDFSNFERIMFNLKSEQSVSRLNELKSELNKFFRDSICEEVLYTKNTDKLFFGMCVMPMMNSYEAVKAFNTEKFKMRITRYYLEIDSKLLDSLLGLTSKELVAILLHEVGHMVKDAQPMEQISDATHLYMAKNDDVISTQRSNEQRDLFGFAVKESLRKVTSMFEYSDDELIADEFSVRCGYGRDLETAYRKIVRSVGKINKEVDNKLLVLQWSLRIYRHMGIERIGALKILNKALATTGSELEKRNIRTVIKSLSTGGNYHSIQEGLDLFKKTDEIYKAFKYNGMRSLENDLYVISAQCTTIDDQDLALSLIRQINMRLSIIDDYMSTEKLSQSELERWDDLGQKYRMLRQELSKKDLYTNKYLSIYVSSPTVSSRFDY